MWVETALVAPMLLFYQVVFGNFEERTPRWRILVKHCLGISILISVSYFFGRFW